MKKPSILLWVFLALTVLVWATLSEDSKIVDSDSTQMKVIEEAMQMMIDETAVSVEWENNDAVSELKEIVKEAPLRIQMSMYGGFEQVGSLGTSLARNDVQMVTQPGDIVLYSGNQLVVFYGSNSWTYTKLGRITNYSDQELTELLGNGDVTILLQFNET